MTRDELITKKFPHTLIGYDINSVDRFIDEIIRELDRLHAELDGLKRELSGSTAESVIEEANVIEAEDERKRLERREDEAPDRTYGSFLPAEFLNELNEKPTEEKDELSIERESEIGNPVEEDLETPVNEAGSPVEESLEELGVGAKASIIDDSEVLDLDEILCPKTDEGHDQPVSEPEMEEHMSEPIGEEDVKIKVKKPRQKGIYRPSK